VWRWWRMDGDRLKALHCFQSWIIYYRLILCFCIWIQGLERPYQSKSSNNNSTTQVSFIHLRLSQ
jgi:hypothetical protein